MSEAMTEANTLQFSKVCMKIEGLCAELYHFYSELFADNRDAALIWKKTALEEENHQKQFKLAIELMKEIDFELTASDLKKACDVHRKTCMLLDIVRRNPPDLITALTKSIEMENCLAELHVESALHVKDDSIKKMFQALQQADQDHVKSLQLLLSIVSLPNAEMHA